MRVEQNDALARAEVSRCLGVDLAQPFVGLCLYDGDALVGAVVLNDYTGANIELTAMLDGPVSIKVLREIARYVFGRLGCRRVTARTKVSNVRAKYALTLLGFKREGLAREWFDGEDALLFGLLRTEQRIIRRTD